MIGFTFLVVWKKVCMIECETFISRSYGMVPAV